MRSWLRVQRLPGQPVVRAIQRVVGFVPYWYYARDHGDAFSRLAHRQVLQHACSHSAHEEGTLAAGCTL